MDRSKGGANGGGHATWG